MPPTIAAAKPLMVRRRRRFGSEETTTEASAIPATPATIEPDTHETTASVRADTPSRAATSGSVAEARMARPVRVARKNRQVVTARDGEDHDHAEALPRHVDAADGEGRRAREDGLVVGDDELVGPEELLREGGEEQGQAQRHDDVHHHRGSGSGEGADHHPLDDQTEEGGDDQRDRHRAPEGQLHVALEVEVDDEQVEVDAEGPPGHEVVVEEGHERGHGAVGEVRDPGRLVGEHQAHGEQGVDRAGDEAARQGSEELLHQMDASWTWRRTRSSPRWVSSTQRARAASHTHGRLAAKLAASSLMRSVTA